jgi:hypothetical protein
MSERARRLLLAWLEISLALLLLGGVWIALPARWWPVDATGSALAAFLSAGAVGLLLRRRWGRLLSLAANWLMLLGGMAAVTALCFTAAHLWGLYGPVGSGGALLMASVAALVLPYLIGLPALQLVLLRGLDR